MSSPTDKMIAQFKSLEDLQAFAKAQQKTLIDMTKKLRASEDEIKHLKKLLEGAVPLVNPPTKVTFSAHDEEQIAREQLFLLKTISKDKELTMEEAKKVEIFSKILNSLKDKKPSGLRDIELQAKSSSLEQLTATLNVDENDDDRSDNSHQEG